MFLKALNTRGPDSLKCNHDSVKNIPKHYINPHIDDHLLFAWLVPWTPTIKRIYLFR